MPTIVNGTGNTVGDLYTVTSTNAGNTIWVTNILNAWPSTTTTSSGMFNNWSCHEQMFNNVPYTVFEQQSQLNQPAIDRFAAEQEAREQAEIRARSLLESYLSADQLRTLQRHGWFIVRGGQTGNRYVILTRRGISGNIRILNERHRAIASLCVHLPENVPESDHYLAQKIWLEQRETEVEVLGIANERRYSNTGYGDGETYEA